MINIREKVGERGIRRPYVRGRTSKLIDMAMKVHDWSTRVTLVMMTMDTKVKFAEIFKKFKEKDDTKNGI